MTLWNYKPDAISCPDVLQAKLRRTADEPLCGSGRSSSASLSLHCLHSPYQVHWPKPITTPNVPYSVTPWLCISHCLEYPLSFSHHAPSPRELVLLNVLPVGRTRLTHSIPDAVWWPTHFTQTPPLPTTSSMEVGAVLGPSCSLSTIVILNHFLIPLFVAPCFLINPLSLGRNVSRRL